ncbi:phosphatidylserine decarboxylase precursor-related protein [Neorhodopirellula lusitana]|uniref:Phosphatidylserine decarboxylase-related protein n=1 Tax=Neorhodopirellula lusitana TaxID=445327 RepID=A0ABY1PRZ6_9BACT|nr:phosphatidylserine decarboxylase family protein [Neorhodopirellula lusitana]SMP40865.1 phosphatidylserine decarboxylase precursor-related protein [Neorhodopirellula lusitana]
MSTPPESDSPAEVPLAAVSSNPASGAAVEVRNSTLQPGDQPSDPIAPGSPANPSGLANPSGSANSGASAPVVAGPNCPAMDPAVKTIQPGGGVVMSLELLWGRLRRAFLRRFRPRYVARMADRRQGQRGDLPFDPVDSRDMKYYRNQGSYWWADVDDAFMWRDSLPFVRVGLAELFVLSGGFLLLAIVMGVVWWPLALPGLLVMGLVVWFFRDPRRVVPAGAGTVVSPADGKLVEIVEFDDPVIGPAIRFGIFLSIFNVHANRTALPGRVVSVQYHPGKFCNAMRPQSARENEKLDIELSSPDLGGRVIRIRQITGQFARRIVCWARVDDFFERGEMYGMIKLGSRTELVVPRDESLHVEAKLGEKVSAGSTIMARYEIES